MVSTESTRATHVINETEVLSNRHAIAHLWEKLSRDALTKIPALDRWLDGEFRASKKYGKRDRKQIRDAFFYVFRNMDSLFLQLAGDRSVVLPPDELARFVLRKSWADVAQAANNMGRAQLPALETVGFLSSYLSMRKAESSWSDEDLTNFVTRLSEPAELWLRMNDFLHPTERIVQSLQAEQIEILDIQGLALRVRAQQSLYFSKSFQAGMFEIQDFASQQIGRALKLSVPQKIWDVCAGAGGKALQLGAIMRSGGAVFCTDVRAKPLEELKKRARRNGLTNIRTLLWDGHKLPELPKAVAKQGGFDALLVDAPCTSSGTWRRNPEARYRLNAETIQSFHKLQLSILCKVAETLRPGGSLVYSTCSWFVDENESTVEAFLATEKGRRFQLREMMCCGSPLSNSDTMFYAVLEYANR